MITRTGIRLAKLASRTRIEPLVDRFTQELRSGKGNGSSAAKELYEAVLMPIKEWRTARRLLVVPDGRLHLLPFDALLTQNAIVGPPVVSTVPSANVFVQLRSRQPVAKPERALLGIGGVPYDQMFASGKPQPAQRARARREGSLTPRIRQNCPCSRLRRVKL